MKIKLRTRTVVLTAISLTGALVLAFGIRAQQPAASPDAKQIVPANLAEHQPPAQPIPYSHKLHLALGLECKTCHTNPDPGKLMTFPATTTCMSCHASVAKSKPAIQKLTGFAKSQEAVPWVRVYASNAMPPTTRPPFARLAIRGPRAEVDFTSPGFLS